jgi:hypothetical protein
MVRDLRVHLNEWLAPVNGYAWLADEGSPRKTEVVYAIGQMLGTLPLCGVMQPVR